MNSHKGKEWKLVLLGTVFVLCVLPVLYITVFRSIDAAFCHRKMMNNLGARNSTISVESVLLDYVEDNLEEGMPREEVAKKLEVIAPIEVDHFEIADYITIGGCIVPINKFVIRVYYNDDGTYNGRFLPDY
jgi:hypothetical protein